jgi:beta-1,4-mannosyltransferase
MLNQEPRRATLRVASVPSRHVYVRRITPAAVQLVADPTGDDLRNPSLLSPEWVRGHASEFDLMHIHFGFEHYDPQQLADLAHELRAAGRPLVYTVHDLRNPNHAERELHDAGLAVLADHADELITLTEGAASEVERRFGRRPVVLEHPHVVPLERMAAVDQERVRDPRRQRRIGLHLKSLRPNIAGLTMLQALRRTVSQVPELTLRVDVHRDVFERGTMRHDPQVAAELHAALAAGDTDLHVHDYFADAELWDYLESLEAFVLPYRFGTHSGFLEACHDLGVAVIAPQCGYYAEQGADYEFRMEEDGTVDDRSLLDAVTSVARDGAPPPASVEAREKQRGHVQERHLEIYRRLLTAVAT